VNDLAACYKRHGLKVEGPRGENQIVQKLTKVLALDRTTVIDYIDKDFLQSPSQLARAQGLPIVPASQRVEKALNALRQTLRTDFVNVNIIPRKPTLVDVYETLRRRGRRMAQPPRKDILHPATAPPAVATSQTLPD
jgi:hypothetical protein